MQALNSRPGCSDKYMRFGLEGGKSIILDRAHAQREGPRILEQHAITFDRSADLRCASAAAPLGVTASLTRSPPIGRRCSPVIVRVVPAGFPQRAGLRALTLLL